MGATQYSAEVLADTPKAFWKFQDASGSPVDASGNGLTLSTVTGTPIYQAAGPMSDFSIQLDGGENFQRATPVSTVQDNFTMETWVYPITVGAAGRTLMANDSTGSGVGWGIGITTDFTFNYYAGNGIQGAPSTVALIANTWSHIVVLRRATIYEYYINGIVDQVNAGNTAPGVSDGPSQVGAGNNLSARFAYPAIYESALSVDRIQAHFAAAGGTAAATAGNLLLLGVG